MLRYCDGFEDYDDSQLPQFWASRPGSVVYGSMARGGAGGCLESEGDIGYQLFSPPASGIWTQGCALKFGYAGPNWIGIFSWRDNAGNEQANFSVNSAGYPVLSFPQVGSTYTGSAPCLVANTYEYYEVNITFNASGAGGFIVRKAQAVLPGMNVSSINTLSNSSMTIGMVGGGCNNGSNNMFLDDWYMTDGDNTDGAGQTGFLGDVRVITLNPIANGRVNNYTPSAGANWQNVRDANGVTSPYPDSDATYNADSTVNDIDCYQVAALSGSPTVVAAMIRSSMRKDDSNIRTVALGFGDGTAENFDSGHALGSNYAGYTRPMGLNPRTGLAWTAANLATAQVAVKTLA